MPPLMFLCFISQELHCSVSVSPVCHQCTQCTLSVYVEYTLATLSLGLGIHWIYATLMTGGGSLWGVSWPGCLLTIFTDTNPYIWVGSCKNSQTRALIRGFRIRGTIADILNSSDQNVCHISNFLDTDMVNWKIIFSLLKGGKFICNSWAVNLLFSPLYILCIHWLALALGLRP